MLRLITLSFVLLILTISCVIDSLPQVNVSINNKDGQQIDSILLTVDSTYSYKQSCKIVGISNNYNGYWMADTFYAVVFVKNKLPIKSNVVVRKTFNDYYNLVIENNKVSLLKIEDSLIGKLIFYLLVMLFVSFGFKTLPSLLFVKPVNKNRYLIISTLINLGYCVFIIGGSYLIESLKIGEMLPTAILLIVISFIIDSLIYSFLLTKDMKFIRLLSCILITNILFYFGGIMILMLILLMK